MFGAITGKILTDLVILAKVGVCKPPNPPCGVGDFTIQFPISQVLSVILVTCSLTQSFLEYCLASNSKEHLSVLSGEPLGDESPVASPFDEPVRPRPSIKPLQNVPADERSGSDVPTKSRIDTAFDWLLERTERADIQRFGRRLPGRRLMLTIGLCLNVAVLSDFYQGNFGMFSCWRQSKSTWRRWTLIISCGQRTELNLTIHLLCMGGS